MTDNEAQTLTEVLSIMAETLVFLARQTNPSAVNLAWLTTASEKLEAIRHEAS